MYKELVAAECEVAAHQGKRGQWANAWEYLPASHQLQLHVSWRFSDQLNSRKEEGSGEIGFLVNIANYFW